MDQVFAFKILYVGLHVTLTYDVVNFDESALILDSLDLINTGVSIMYYAKYI